MASKQFFEDLLESQNLSTDEIKRLEWDRDEIEELIRNEFGDVPNIRIGGSFIKGTMVRDSYDLDVPCYFPRENEDNPETLEDIYDSVKTLLESTYDIVEKTSAIHVKKKIEGNSGYHIDVVPGRYIDGNDGDVFLHKTRDWSRIQTNIDTHIENIRDSGRLEVIRLFKLWSIRNSLNIRTFVLELFAIKALEGMSGSIEKQFFQVLESAAEKIEDIQLVDPANSANIVSDIIDVKEKKAMADIAKEHLKSLEKATDDKWTIDVSVWEEIFRDKRTKSFYWTAQWIHVSRGTPSVQAAIIPNKPWKRI